MSTTTQILFNSPALHSLKRDQLVKLCKIHAVKASGKNTDLIDRLKKHAATLPRDTPLSVAMRSEGIDENDDDHGDGEDDKGVLSEGQDEHIIGHQDVAGIQMPRPSEQWEVVMESIQEVEENSSQSTLSSLRTLSNGSSHATGEFGTGSSKGEYPPLSSPTPPQLGVLLAATSVSSSLKAFATSLGLKRNTTSSTKSKPTAEMPSNPHPTDELARKAIPYSSLPETDPSALPKTDPFTFAQQDNPEPIPGHALRPGVQAPFNARLSIGTTAAPGPTTTIRLVSASYIPTTDHPSTPILRPFTTSFDLVAGSPSASAGLWPPKEDNANSIYPAVPTPSPLANTHTSSVDMPGALTATPPRVTIPAPETAPAVQASPALTLAQNPSAPFVFGSPLPQHRLSNQQFRNAAASVLEEMNKRLADQGIEPLSLDMLNGTGRSSVNLGAHGKGGAAAPPLVAGAERFERAHEREFSKMDSIANHWSARRAALEGAGCTGKKRKSSLVLGKKSRPSVSKASATRVISGGRRKMGIPGAFGDDDAGDGEDGEENRRLSKKPRVEGDTEQTVSKEKEVAKRVSIAPPAAMEDDEAAQEEEKKRLREKEAIRRKLDKSKARRRSSMGRVSLGGKAPLAPRKIIRLRVHTVYS